MNYMLAVTRHHVAYSLETCPHLGPDHGPDDCTGDCTWLEGGYRSISDPETEHHIMPADSDRTAVAWAVEELRPLHSFEPSSYPVGTSARAHEWLSACEVRGDDTRIEISARLVGDWSEEERAEAFRLITA